LQDIAINGMQVFHTAIITEKGPETGYSQVIVAADPSNPSQLQKKLLLYLNFIK
jgi:hypothetical protein